MPIKNTSAQFGSMAKALHWLIALLILSLLCVGFYMIGMEFSPLKLQIYSLHKSFGLTVLILGIVRIIWKSLNPQPHHLPSHTTAERLLAKLMHILLYTGIFVMPLSGWIMSSAGDYPASFFGLFDIPHITSKNEALYELMKAVHEISAYALIGAVGLHYLGAIKHHIIDRDETLRRMGGNLFIGGIFGLFLLSATLLAVQSFLSRLNNNTAIQTTSVPLETKAENISAPTSDEWVIDPDQSHIHFTFSQYGTPITGSFENWDARINFDPDNLETASATVTIDIASISTGSADRDEQARSAEWFAASQFPEAVFKSAEGGFSSIENNQYKVLGTLQIREISRPTDFIFTLDIAEQNAQKTANMNAKFNLNRLPFGIGQGQWENGEAIGENVTIELDVKAAKPLQNTN